MSTSNASSTAPMESHPCAAQAVRMDRMYRLQRHFYDLTRKFYLLGRDDLLTKMNVQAGQTVLEVGCGTGRNLAILARRHPDVRFWGLDASTEMLKTAAATMERKKISERVVLRQALAEELDPEGLFGLARPFDTIFFSYSLSMIPTWEQAVEKAISSLAPQGHLHIVDFCDQMGLPAPLRWMIKRWLALFGVHHKPELVPALERMAGEGKCELQVKYLYGRYAFRADVSLSNARP